MEVSDYDITLFYLLSTLTENPSLLPHLEALKSTSRVEERQHLLLWILKVFEEVCHCYILCIVFSQELHREATGTSDSPPMSRQLTQVEEVDLPSPTNRRQALAEEHRLIATDDILIVTYLSI